MKRILHLVSSLQGNAGYSVKLGNAIVEQVIEKYPGSTVETVDLVALNFPHFTPTVLQAMYAPGEQLTAEGHDSIRYSNDAIQQLLAADIIVIGAPFYNFSVPSVLKAWLDHVTKAGVTFKYSETGPVGLVTGKKVYVAMSSGGVYSEGPGQANDFVAPYLKSFLGLLGMTDLSVFRVEGVKIPGIQEHAWEKGIASIVID